MGMFDTMNQAPGNSIQNAVPNGGSFAQKQQMKANPIMRGKPAMAPGFGQQKPNPMQNAQGNPFGAAAGMRPNTMTGARPAMNPGASVGMAGSRPQIQAQQLAAKQQQQAQSGLSPSIPQYEQLKQAMQAQKGGLIAPYEAAQRQESLAQQQSPMQSAQEQMRGYEGPDLGSQDPRELARVGQTSLQNAPFQGGGNPSFQDMARGAEFNRPDVMDRGIGPSAELFGGQPMNEMQPQVRPRISVNDFRGRSGAY